MADKKRTCCKTRENRHPYQGMRVSSRELSSLGPRMDVGCILKVRKPCRQLYTPFSATDITPALLCSPSQRCDAVP